MIAVIIFQKIHTPGCKCVRINKFMLEAAWISGTSQVARTGIHTKFQTFGMHMYLFLTRDTHPDNYLATREGRRLPVEHCIEGEDGWNFAPELENALDGTDPEVCHIVNKPTFGSYMLPSEILDELMAHNKAVDDIEKIVVYGYCTDICVISNAMVLRAAFPETEIEILSDCCAGVTPESHQTALDAMRACQFTIV